MPLPLLWSQVLLAAATPASIPAWKLWLIIWGDPGWTLGGFWGPWITWLKVVGLFCLLGWTFSWVVAAMKERAAARFDALSIAAMGALGGILLAALLGVLEANKRIGPLTVARLPVPQLLGMASAGVIVLWIERALWSSVLRLGTRPDRTVLAGLHVALGMGVVGGLLLRDVLGVGTELDRVSAVILPATRLAATFMGYVVLARVVALLAVEVVAVRARRLYAIAWQTVLEAVRRMWAPWVVIVVFAVILAFTHWFLQPPREVELGRLFVGTLMLLSALLLTVMVAILTPISLPHDIQQQTIYTVVSKPVRRLELVWGRMLGFMALVTFLLVIFGAISLFYLYRMVDRRITATRDEAVLADARNRHDRAQQLREQADQMEARRSARVPIKGALVFRDAKGALKLQGTNVGSDISRDLEFRSHIEGATPAKAIWNFGLVQDPRNPRMVIDRRIPVERLLRPDSIEGLENQAAELRMIADAVEQRRAAAQRKGADLRTLDATLTQAREEARQVEARLTKLRLEEADLRRRARAGGTSSQAVALRQQADALHSPAITIETTFNVVRLTKGVIGEAVHASLKATNTYPYAPSIARSHSVVFPIREYYINRVYLPASILVGSHGHLAIEVQCLTPSQYLGMSESDLYILASLGTFWVNYVKGLLGIWLQAMVLTAIGVFAGTFLSWPVALLTTVAFFLSGQVAFSFLQDLALQTMLGGGPSESLIRLLSHDNQMTKLNPTLPVVVAKTLDALVVPIMSRLVYLVPNFSALDLSDQVADGFAVEWPTLAEHVLMALGYALPFSVAGYFILKNREVAA